MSVFRYAEGSEPKDKDEQKNPEGVQEEKPAEDTGPGDVITDESESFESSKTSPTSFPRF